MFLPRASVRSAWPPITRARGEAGQQLVWLAGLPGRQRPGEGMPHLVIRWHIVNCTAGFLGMITWTLDFLVPTLLVSLEGCGLHRVPEVRVGSCSSCRVVQHVMQWVGAVRCPRKRVQGSRRLSFSSRWADPAMWKRTIAFAARPCSRQHARVCLILRLSKCCLSWATTRLVRHACAESLFCR